MSELLERISFQHAKFNSQVGICLILIWFAVLACAVSSINAQPFTKKQRRFWLLVVTLVPIFGVLAYLPFSFNKDELPEVFLLKAQSEKNKRARKNGTLIQQRRGA